MIFFLLRIVADELAVHLIVSSNRNTSWLYVIIIYDYDHILLTRLQLNNSWIPLKWKQLPFQSEYVGYHDAHKNQLTYQ